MDASHGLNYPLLGATAPSSTVETSQQQEPARPNPEVSVVPDVTATTGIKRHFTVTFDRKRYNTDKLAQLMESINSSITHTKELPAEEKKIILQLLNLMNDTINSLQKHEIPESALTQKIVEEVLEKIIENPKISPNLRNSLDLLFCFFPTCKFFDYFMYGTVDQKLCRDLANFLSTIPEKEPLEIMAGAGWLQKGLKEQGLPIRSTDNFRISESDQYSNPRLAEELFRITAMKEQSKNFAVIEGASVEEMDALKALEASSSRVVIMCWPDPRCKDLMYKILEHCYKNQKMIIHIANSEESLRKFLVRPGEESSFIPVKGAPSSHIHLEDLSIGFWKQEPEWFKERLKALEKPAEKEPRPDFMIRHFEL